MKILAIDTATPCASCALWADDGPVAASMVVAGRHQAEVLMPAIDELCRRAGWSVSDLDGVAVDIGPGLFTGLRVGLATARTIARAEVSRRWASPAWRLWLTLTAGARGRSSPSLTPGEERSTGPSSAATAPRWLRRCPRLSPPPRSWRPSWVTWPVPGWSFPARPVPPQSRPDQSRPDQSRPVGPGPGGRGLAVPGPAGGRRCGGGRLS